MFKLKKYFRILTLCPLLIGCFLLFSCSTLSNKTGTDSAAGFSYLADVKLIANAHAYEAISMLSEMGFKPVLTGSGFSEANDASDTVTIRICIHDRQQLKLFLANAAAAGIRVSDIKIE